jgi:23S rRNA-/tRNA-specific pseudouridylate synthase
VTEPDRLRFRVVPVEHGMALRTLVARRMPGTSARGAAALIRAGGVYVDELRIRVPGVRVVTGERITIYPGADAVARIDPDALVVVGKSAAWWALDKPAGVPAEARRQSCFGSLSDALVRALAREGIPRPYVALVHALPPGASGLVVFAVRGSEGRRAFEQLRASPFRATYRLLATGDALPPDARPVARREGRVLFELDADGSEGPQIVQTAARAAGLSIVGDDDGAPELCLCRVAATLGEPALDLRATPPAWAR